MLAAELEYSSGTLQYILSINVTECSVIIVVLWIKGGGLRYFKKTFKMKYRVLISILKYSIGLK